MLPESNFFLRMHKKRTTIFLLVLLHVAGCAAVHPSNTACIKNGQIYGNIPIHRHNFWNFYERGLSFAEGECYSEAVNDFEQAIKLLSTDGRGVTTYGMNYIDYFPHRELGILFYKVGNFQKAEKELSRSISQWPTAKAHYFIDQTRKSTIRQESALVFPPIISLDFKTDEVWTRDQPFLLSGIAKDEQYVKFISIQKKPQYLIGSKKEVWFSQSFNLNQGDYVFEVEARDLIGTSSTKRIIVHVDREGPMIVLDKFTVTATPGKKKVFLTGTLRDRAGVGRLTGNGKVLTLAYGSQTKFNVTLYLEAAAREFELVASDRLENQTTLRLPLSSSSTSTDFPLFASLESPAVGKIITAQTDNNSNIILDEFFKNKKRITCYQEEVPVSIKIEPAKKLSKLLVNNKIILSGSAEIYKITIILPLKLGENLVEIKAIDHDNQESVKKIIILKEENPKFAIGNRLLLSVGTIKYDEEGEIKDKLTRALYLLKRFQVKDADDPAHSNEWIIQGRFKETRDGIEFSATIKDPQQILRACPDVFDISMDIEAITKKMALRIMLEFPDLMGKITYVKDKNITASIHYERDLTGRRLIIYREETPYSVPTKIGYATIFSNMLEGKGIDSIAELEKSTIGRVKKEDKVITE